MHEIKATYLTSSAVHWS